MSLAGKKVALTGTLDLKREDFRKRVAEAGGEYVMNVDDGVDVLVVGDKPLVARVDKARRLGVTIVDKQGFDDLAVGVARLDGDDDTPLALEDAVDAPPSFAVTDQVRILDMGLPVRPGGPLTPSLDLFQHYTLDEPTLKMLRFIARAVRLRQPCLLEGETATSKTSAILFLAALSGHQVVRINLNGQTDTSELVGRYVPNDAVGGAAWRFSEGLVPLAMRLGWWVILDEVNLAEPPVLERLNSVLERDPTLVLTEGPGTRFGAGGDVPLHPDFRVFATMNPAEYQGRSVLSPAYKDRWVATWQAEAPGEREYRQMLERVVYGRHPDVDVGGLRYRGALAWRDGEAPYAKLGTTPGVPAFLSRLAALHAGLVRMATASEGKSASLGASRRERYVFSRRALIAVLDGLGSSSLINPRTGDAMGFAEAPAAIAIDAIERAYLDRVRGDDDRARVHALMRSLGLDRDGWMHAFEEASS